MPAIVREAIVLGGSGQRVKWVKFGSASGLSLGSGLGSHQWLSFGFQVRFKFGFGSQNPKNLSTLFDGSPRQIQQTFPFSLKHPPRIQQQFHSIILEDPRQPTSSSLPIKFSFS
ncbi:hypothetical protein Hdeb2414_s0002g00062841 [Helianthus debilis subsp. tardiflorus]